MGSEMCIRDRFRTSKGSAFIHRSKYEGVIPALERRYLVHVEEGKENIAKRSRRHQRQREGGERPRAGVEHLEHALREASPRSVQRQSHAANERHRAMRVENAPRCGLRWEREAGRQLNGLAPGRIQSHCGCKPVVEVGTGLHETVRRGRLVEEALRQSPECLHAERSA